MVQAPALARYFAAKVLLPGASVVTRNVALVCAPKLAFALEIINACVSEAGRVVAPDTAKPIKHCRLAMEFDIWAVSVTSAGLEEDTLTVTVGPLVGKSLYVVAVVVSDAAVAFPLHVGGPAGPLGPTGPCGP
jgi:hypothetical protein